MILALTSIERFLVFVLTLSVLILVHEWGHFFVARRSGVGVREFALGFGPALYSWQDKKSGTTYRLNAFPMGGYCAMVGEDGAVRENDIAIQGSTFMSIGPWKRLAICYAGPAVNLLMAFLLVAFGAMTLGVDTMSTRVDHLMPNNPAQKAGLVPGDTILSIDGVTMTDGKQMVTTINKSLGKTLTIVYTHDTESKTIHVKPVPLTREGKTIGIIGFTPKEVYERQWPVAAVKTAWIDIAGMTTATLEGFGELFHGKREALNSVSGPIGIARAAVSIQDYGPGLYLQFVALLSVSLGIFNLLPFPALDGGRGLFIVFELLRGRPIDPDREAMVHLTGFAAIILLAVIVSYHDIINITAGHPAF